jgi:hypothetical protein
MKTNSPATVDGVPQKGKRREDTLLDGAMQVLVVKKGGEGQGETATPGTAVACSTSVPRRNETRGDPVFSGSNGDWQAV